MTGSQPPAAGGWRGEQSGRANGQNRAYPHAQSAPAPQFRSLDESAATARQQVPGWKSITIQVPHSDDRMLAVSIDKSIGGQPEQASQLVINRQTGQVETMKRFADNSAGRKLRAWSRFVHTGEEFGIFGEMIAAMACIGAIVLVWTGLSMAIRRALSTQAVRNAIANPVALHEGASALD